MNKMHSLSVSGTVARVLEQRQMYLDLADRFGSPLFVIEETILLERAAQFLKAFRAHFLDMEAYFPVKANSHPSVIGILVKAGMGIEVSSGLELERAVNAGAQRILFNGPAKTPAELNLALAHRDVVTVILDSATELTRLEESAAQKGVSIRTGIRLCVANHGIWCKFGIPLAELAGFLHHARCCTHIDVQGLHFHTSWNVDPAIQVQTLKLLGKALQMIPPDVRQNLSFVDIGGGFWPPQGQWLPALRPADAAETEEAAPFFTSVPAVPIADFAAGIASAFEKHIFPFLPCRLYAEPGRWICNDAVQILLTVLDVKDNKVAITDGGTNLVGWERFESEYFPLVNLSRPALEEHPFPVLGSLCTPHDLWGYSCFGSGIQIGDILLIPMQGAYTYSLRQSFIKPLPRTILIPAARHAGPCDVSET